MTWNGSGDFQRVHNFSADASAGIKILASRQDAEWANFEGGLENCITRDGQNSPTADLPMNGQKHTNVAAPASTTHYMRAAEYIRSFPIYCAFGGTAEAMSASAQFALTSLTAGIQVLLSCPSVNTTTSVTLGLTGITSAQTVVRADGRGPGRGQVKGLHRYIYDGANWILTDPSPIRGKLVVKKSVEQSVSLNSPGAPVVSETVLNFDTAVINEDTAWVSASASCSLFTVPGGIRAVDIHAKARLKHTDNGTLSFSIQTTNADDARLGSNQPITQTFSASALPYISIMLTNVSVKDTTVISIGLGANVSASCDDFTTFLAITPRD
jgi:hypothetical protein